MLLLLLSILLVHKTASDSNGQVYFRAYGFVVFDVPATATATSNGLV